MGNIDMKDVIRIVSKCDSVEQAVVSLTDKFYEKPVLVQYYETPTSFNGARFRISIIGDNKNTLLAELGDEIWDNEDYIRKISELSIEELMEEGIPHEIVVDAYYSLKEARKLGWLD